MTEESDRYISPNSGYFKPIACNSSSLGAASLVFGNGSQGESYHSQNDWSARYDRIKQVNTAATACKIRLTPDLIVGEQKLQSLHTGWGFVVV